MTRNKAHRHTGNAMSIALRRARETAVRLQPAADKAMPLAKNAGAAAKHQAHRTRAWAAPQVEKAGQVVQHSFAPKVAALLSAAARRLEPEKPSRRSWRKLAGASAVTAATGAFAAAVRSRKKASAAAATEGLEETDGGPSAPQAPPAMKVYDGQRSPGSDDAQSRERTP
jgi:hypothetical protein